MSLRSERGEFSLPGLLVAMTLFIGVLGATLSLYQGFERVQHDTVDRNDAQDRARVAVDRLARELRNLASPTPDRPESVDRALSYDLVFQSVDPFGPNAGANAANVMRVRYCLSSSAANATLWRQEQRWTTAIPPAAPTDLTCPGTGWSAQSAAADHVVNRRDGLDRTLFSYNGATATADVAIIHSDLYVDLDAARAPAETHLASGIFLRNQNRRPTAAFESPKVTPSGIVLNGSLSSDPEGESMRFMWYDGTTKIGEGITLTYAPPARGTRSISLKVYDPANLEGVAPTVAVTW
jgi:hypothetical protein